MTIRISEDTIVLVAVVIGIFLLALLCLACSLNPRELLDGSLFRCCQCCRRRRRRTIDENAAPHIYDTLNEFIFESEQDNHGDDRRGVLSLSNMPTTMEQVFPDLLGSDEPPTPQGDVENALFGNNRNNGENTDLREPLL